MNNFFDPDNYNETNETEPKFPQPPITSFHENDEN